MIHGTIFVFEKQSDFRGDTTWDWLKFKLRSTVFCLIRWNATLLATCLLSVLRILFWLAKDVSVMKCIGILSGCIGIVRYAYWIRDLVRAADNSWASYFLLLYIIWVGLFLFIGSVCWMFMELVLVYWMPLNLDPKSSSFLRCPFYRLTLGLALESNICIERRRWHVHLSPYSLC